MATALAQNFPDGAVIRTVRHAGNTTGADSEIVVTVSEKAYRILSAGFIPDTTQTGADTTYRIVGFVNKGSAGSGTTAIKAVKNYVSGVGLTACVADELINAADAKSIAENEVVTFASTHASTGRALPAGLVYMVLWPL